MRRFALLGLLALGCAREPGLFVEANARAHIGMLAGTIGTRPVGTPANARAREYVVDQLKQIGFNVRVQEVDARRHELGLTARVANIIGVLPGDRPEAIGLIAHYDSSPEAPGATDDALGVGIALETARVFAASPRRHWSLLVIVTDGEENGLMGAAAIVTDRDVMDRLRAYLNLESIGSSGPVMLFETGPANAWIVSPWARRAPHPRGGSYAIEIYQRLPNDTDFSIFKTRDVPGLNFAAVGDSYAYHTPRDTPDRLSRPMISTFGENVITVLTAMQDVDITQRTGAAATFFDVAGMVGVSYRPMLQWLIGAAALILGVIACVRVTADTIRHDGVLRWLLAIVWGWTGAAGVFGAMAATTWLVRSAREVYHPWYARPGRLFVLLILIGVTAGWSIVRLGQWLPTRAHLARHPSLTWSIALPVWILLATAALWAAPAAAYLWILPLLAAGIFLAPLPPQRDWLIRTASFLVLIVSSALWLTETQDLLRFVVAIMGRLPIVTTVIAYAGLLAAAATMVIPPTIAAFATSQRLLRPWIVTSMLLLATVVAAAAVYMAPAYTIDQPLRRHVRALQDGGAAEATWEVASIEPGLDLLPNAPPGWQPVDTARNRSADSQSARADAPPGSPAQPERSIPWGRYDFPFVFRTAGPALGPAPASLGAFTITPLPDGTRLTVAVVPREAGVTVSFVLPPGLIPARSNFPGIRRFGRWTASFVAPPAEGIAWEASFRGSVSEDQLRASDIMVTSPRFPDGTGWQSLPDWLPQDTMVWSARATWLIPLASAPSIAPVPALR